MIAEDLEQITVKRLRNRLTLVRKRIGRKMRYLDNNGGWMDPRRVDRWMAAIRRDKAEYKLLVGWIEMAGRHGGVFIYRKKKCINK